MNTWSIDSLLFIKQPQGNEVGGSSSDFKRFDFIFSFIEERKKSKTSTTNKSNW